MYSSVLTHIVDYALSMGIASGQAYNLMVYWGVAGISGRLLSGFCSSGDKQRRLWTFFCWVVLMGSSVFVFPFIIEADMIGSPQTWFIIFLSVHGLSSGAWLQLYMVVMADVFGIENMHLSTGMTISCQVPVSIFGPTLAGLIADKTNSFYEYVFLGICSLLSLPFCFYFVKESLKLDSKQCPDHRKHIEMPVKEGDTRNSVESDFFIAGAQ